MAISASVRARQQKLSDRYGIVTFTQTGAISTTPKSGVIKINEGTGGLSASAFAAALRNRGVTSYLGTSIAAFGGGSPSVQVQVVKSNPQQSTVISNAYGSSTEPVTIFGGVGLSDKVKALQQNLSEKYGIVTFDTKGDISTIPMTRPITEDTGSGKFDPNSFAVIRDALNAALFPTPNPAQNPQSQISNSQPSLLDSLKAGLTDIGSQLNSFIGQFKIPDSSGSQGNLPTQQQQADQSGGGLLGGAPSTDTSTNSPTADTSTTSQPSFFDQLKKNPTELVIIIVAIIALFALIARRR